MHLANNSISANGVVSIDKKWFSWTNQNSVVLNAFKIAWLGYTPSDVAFNGKSYKRWSLINLRAQIIETFWTKMSTLIPFGDQGEKLATGSEARHDSKERINTALKSENAYTEYCNE